MAEASSSARIDSPPALSEVLLAKVDRAAQLLDVASGTRLLDDGWSPADGPVGF